MSLMSELFLASEEHVRDLDIMQGAAAMGLTALPFSGIDYVMIATLDDPYGATLDEALDGMPMLKDGDAPGPWLFPLRTPFVHALAATSEEAIPGLAARWGDTEEISASDEEKVGLAKLLGDTRALAQEAARRSVGMYFWVSL